VNRCDADSKRCINPKLSSDLAPYAKRHSYTFSDIATHRFCALSSALLTSVFRGCTDLAASSISRNLTLQSVGRSEPDGAMAWHKNWDGRRIAQ
jgi:hypothetical protein